MQSLSQTPTRKMTQRIHKPASYSVITDGSEMCTHGACSLHVAITSSHRPLMHVDAVWFCTALQLPDGPVHRRLEGWHRPLTSHSTQQLLRPSHRHPLVTNAITSVALSVSKQAYKWPSFAVSNHLLIPANVSCRGSRLCLRWFTIMFLPLRLVNDALEATDIVFDVVNPLWQSKGPF